jgi:hypothetical protein
MEKHANLLKMLAKQEYVAPKELATFCGVHVNQVYAWASLPGFPASRAGKRGWLSISLTGFLAWRKTDAAKTLHKA